MNIRPPIGFIVEGHGEFNCYPSLLCKILGSCGYKIPILNAGGCGSVIRRLGDQLSDLMKTDSPENVVITVDLKDALSQKLAQSHDDLKTIMLCEIDRWLRRAENDPKLHPIPIRIVVIIQVVKFESWLIADIEGLKSADLVRADVVQPDDTETIKEPTMWLKEALKVDANIKSPHFAKKIVSAIRPDVMRTYCNSFDMFFVECTGMYSQWKMKIVS